jgi:hypothetical protein
LLPKQHPNFRYSQQSFGTVHSASNAQLDLKLVSKFSVQTIKEKKTVREE